MDQEKAIIEAFTIFTNAATTGHLRGTLSPAQHMDLISKMASCFRDYLVIQRSQVAAQMAIQKAKDAA